MTQNSGKYKNSDVEAYVLMNNAYYHYNQFIKAIRSNSVSNDGKNELLNILEKYVSGDESQRFIKTIRSRKKLYRARIINPDQLKRNLGIDVFDVGGDYQTRGFDEGNSREAPLGMSREGRNNITGVSYLYLADNISTASVEIKSVCGQLVSVAEFETSKPLRVVDFSTDVMFDVEESREDNIALGTLFTLIMSRFFLPVSDTSEYLATQIITDHIRKTGIDGIAYKSFYDMKGTNYTIFNSNRDSIRYRGSRILMHKSVNNAFLSRRFYHRNTRWIL